MGIVNGTVDDEARLPREGGRTHRAPHLVTPRNAKNALAATGAMPTIVSQHLHRLAIVLVADMSVWVARETKGGIALRASVLVADAALPCGGQEAATALLCTSVHKGRAWSILEGWYQLRLQLSDGYIEI